MKIKHPVQIPSYQKNKGLSQSQFIQGHILKFIKKGKAHQDRGIICFPQQTYGNSEQSPDHFKGETAMIPQNGYSYKHQNKPQFGYYSQKRYFSIDGSKNQQDSKLIHQQNPQNVFKFHRKKGKLSQFIDKNGWMNKTVRMTGFQRDQKARWFSNLDRIKKIQNLKQKINYDNITALKPNTSGGYFKTIGTLTANKMNIRAKRNDEAEKFSLSIQPRNIQTSHRIVSKLQKQRVEQKMLQSARNWSPSRDAKSKCQEFAKTFYPNRLNQFQNNLKNKKDQKQYSQRQNYQETLEDWYRTTCSSKWIYRKKIDSQETQQESQFPALNS